MKLLVERVLNSLRFWIDRTDVEAWFARRHVFFVSGMGRSGTKFLSELLDMDRTAAVFHEPVAEDFEAIVEAQHDREAARTYIEEFRIERMYRLVRDRDVTTYGEVNSALRYHMGELAEAFPDARLVHLVRDGRDVVRSIMNRRHYTGGGEGHHSLVPSPATAIGESWESMGRFEKVCWLWADAVDRVEDHTSRRVQLEGLVADYDYFRDQIERYLDLEIGRKAWRRHTERPTNVTQSHSFPHWRDWGGTRQERFEEICGDQMRRVGYW